MRVIHLLASAALLGSGVAAAELKPEAITKISFESACGFSRTMDRPDTNPLPVREPDEAFMSAYRAMLFQATITLPSVTVLFADTSDYGDAPAYAANATVYADSGTVQSEVPVIVYNPKYGELHDPKTGKENWAQYFVFLHEVHHMINRQDVSGSEKQDELDADYHAGRILALLGATQADVSRAFEVIESRGFTFSADAKYSAKTDRLASAQAGWVDVISSLPKYDDCSRWKMEGKVSKCMGCSFPQFSMSPEWPTDYAVPPTRKFHCAQMRSGQRAIGYLRASVRADGVDDTTNTSIAAAIWQAGRVGGGKSSRPGALELETSVPLTIDQNGRVELEVALSQCQTGGDEKDKRTCTFYPLDGYSFPVSICDADTPGCR